MQNATAGNTGNRHGGGNASAQTDTPLGRLFTKALWLLREEDWSPRQISGHLRLEGLRISHERICQIICADET